MRGKVLVWKATCASLTSMTIHLVKLCVGADDVADLAAWQARLMRDLPSPVHHTRMVPKQAQALADGGSIYWVIRRAIRVRQRILDVREIEDRGGRRACELVFDPQLIETEAQPRKPFQGWRYLKPGDVPRDLAGSERKDIPAELGMALREALVW